MLAAGLALVLAAGVAVNPSTAHATGLLVSVKAYYLALGDSLAFGYQPNFDWSHGYAPQWDTDLKTHGSTSFTNHGCPYAWLLHNSYVGAQLNVTVSFTTKHAGQVSPVSLDMGANDLLPDINSLNCAVSSTWSSDLSTLDARLTGTILPKLTAALTSSQGVLSGDLVMMNYYDPYQKQCPNTVPYLQTLNQHLAADAAQFSVPIADVFTAFGGVGVPNNNICTYTWMCSSSPDIHATTTGNGVIAGAFEGITGY